MRVELDDFEERDSFHLEIPDTEELPEFIDHNGKRFVRNHDFNAVYQYQIEAVEPIG